jgi:hypothetical protein
MIMHITVDKIKLALLLIKGQMEEAAVQNSLDVLDYFIVEQVDIVKFII